MATREWKTTSPPGHSVRLEHSYLSGKVLICVDGEKIFERPGKFMDFGLEHRFTIEDVPCIIRILAHPLHFTYELWTDGGLQ